MRITIVGAGFSGTALAVELARRAGPDVEICLVGHEGNYARGVAYGDARPEHLLNVRARNMGVSVDRPGDFADWINLSERARDGFLPRLIYGEYLRDRLAAATELTLAKVGRIAQEVISVQRQDEGFRLHLGDGATRDSDRVVLAVGALPPQALTGVGPALTTHPSYIAWPWREGAAGRIDPDANVLIVGTGLTMADVVSTLRHRGHRGRIVAISRHGLLPAAHDATPPAAISLPPSVLHALHQRDVRLLAHTLRRLTHVLHDWRSLVDALRPFIQDYWTALPAAQRARFMRHLRPYWEVARHRVAPTVLADLQALRRNGQLEVHAGHLLRARRLEDKVVTWIRHRGSPAITIGRHDVLVRATGLDTDILRTQDPLVANLRDEGLLVADPLGLGVQAGADFTALDRRGRPVRGLHVLGPLLRAQLWEITAVPEQRAAAAALAHGLLETQGVHATPRRAERELRR